MVNNTFLLNNFHTVSENIGYSGRYRHIHYIIVVANSPQYYWCDHQTFLRVANNIGTSSNEKHIECSDESIKLFQTIRSDESAVKSTSRIRWFAKDVVRSDEKETIVNIFYCPPHISSISIEATQTILPLSHVKVTSSANTSSGQQGQQQSSYEPKPTNKIKRVLSEYEIVCDQDPNHIFLDMFKNRIMDS